MLKRLELVGFKSFADRTWFDFPAGLTAIVGPNGSGKSNVVDAVRWILGEQSAKSLRGGEMADVIFNGSTSRKGLGMAEVTLTFDNTKKQLNTTAEEVAVTRRVYRDGTGEYLINGLATRLRDLKELFLGSGAGTTSYCIIEQGRVDALLQASNKDRRAIIEEAAGISRFKAKKIETLRKLEHTEENLTRLRDIMGEVETQLRRVRLDAEKARKFQEYSTRLKELRLGLGLREYHTLTERLQSSSGRLEALRHEMSGAQMQLAVWEDEAKTIEANLGQIDTAIAHANESLSETRRKIATFAERQANERTKTTDVENELALSRRRFLELVQLVRALQASAQSSEANVLAAEGEAHVRSERVAEIDAVVQNIEVELVALRKRVQDGRHKQFDLVGRVAALNSEADSARKQLDKFQRDRERKRRESDAKAAELGSVMRVLESLGHRDSDLQNRIALARQTLDDRRAERTELYTQSAGLAETLEDLRVRRSGLTGRIEILENLERSQEGLNTGVREVLAELATGESLLSQAVVGLVADSLRVPREVAPLIDIALGDVASHFVVRDAVLLDAALQQRPAFSGRVSFLPLLPVGPLAEGDETRTADRWVTCEHPELVGLPQQLLGKTLIVPDLATARREALDAELAGYTFVTRHGELLTAECILTTGTHLPEAGILSRKSELRELRVQAASLDDEIGQAERFIADLRERAEALAGPIHGLEEEVRSLTSSATDVQTDIVKQTQQRDRLNDDISLTRQEWEMLEEEIVRLEEFWRDTRAKAADAERHAEDIKTQLDTAEHAIRGYEHEKALRQQEQTAARVALAEITQRLTGLREAHQKLMSDLARGQFEAGRLERHETVLLNRLTESELAALRASAGLAEAFRAKEAFEHVVHEQSAQRETDRARRAGLLASIQGVRSATQQQMEELHAHELQARDLHNARDQICTRLRDDYQLDLAAEYQQSPLAQGGTLLGEWHQPSAEKEVDDLRRKVRHLGNVSLEALSELAQIESRANELQTQITDLSEAEQALRAVINKINEDSKRLFGETFATVREHFQELFRKLFGGGMADVVLENPEDMLETGIEIMARPPGKELRSISLMSGGEKTLTAVALLLAIFQSKPSPFCLLDEVDAALDEANTERLAQTLKAFTDQSQFIMITHKKRTMAYADVLFGITMQESGISKQIAVRLDDYPDDTQQQAA